MEDVDQELALLGAILVEERVLRRIIKTHLEIRGFGLLVPHAQCYTLAREHLEALVQPDEVAVELEGLPEHVIVVHGDREALVAGEPSATSRLWRGLFHARVHLAFDRLALNAATIRQRIHAIGQTEFDEIRTVLRQEDLLLPPQDAATTYIEFVALYLELCAFAPETVARTFPAVFDPAGIDATIAIDVDAAALLAASRPPRAPATPELALPDAGPVAEAPGGVEPLARPAALAAQRRGNRARAAILFARAGDRRTAKEELTALVEQLAIVVGAPSTNGWTEALYSLAIFAANERSVRFGPGARLLQDLQAASMITDDVKAVDAFGWAVSRGTRPLVRALPATRGVRIAKRTRSAVKKIAACNLASPEERERLSTVIHDIAEAANDRLRATLRPEIEAALEQVGLHSRGLLERVGEKKLIDELLDRAVSVGRFSLGDLRDVMSRNDLKLPDLVLEDLGRGDQLLRADKILSSSLDGVYRGGEIYMRALQKVSSVLFGTPIGRFLTLYLMLPLLGSFAVVEGLQHMVGPVWAKLFHVYPVIATNTTLLGGAGALFLLLHVAWCRRATLFVLRVLWRGLRLLLLDAPLVLLRVRVVRLFFQSPFHRWIVKPALVAGVVLLATWQVIEPLRWVIIGVAFAAAAIGMNSRAGQRAEEIVLDGLVRSSRQLMSRVVPGLVKYVIEVFARLVDSFDRFLYRVDEWLRFRTGQSSLKLVFKGLFGTVWFVITYFLRLYVNLFVEPTTNPIKHFPVVTVAAKIMLPFIPAILDAVQGPASVLLGPELGGGFAAFTVLVLPGLAGFLVWEFKENWNLYRRGRSKILRPLAIGHHGETMARLLRPGFHSGTIPKLYSKLRRAAWRNDAGATARATEGLHHVEEAVRTFADRQLVSMLNECVAFRIHDVASSHIEIGSNRVQISLVCPSVAAQPARIRIELQSGWLVASVGVLGWLGELSEDQRKLFEIVLAGFYKQSAIDLVREQLEHAIEDPSSGTPPTYDISDAGIVVWSSGFETEVVCPLRSDRLFPSRGGDEVIDLVRRRALFWREPIYWAVWSATWQQLARGEQPAPVLTGPSLVRNPGSPRQHRDDLATMTR